MESRWPAGQEDDFTIQTATENDDITILRSPQQVHRVEYQLGKRYCKRRYRGHKQKARTGKGARYVKQAGTAPGNRNPSHPTRRRGIGRGATSILFRRKQSHSPSRRPTYGKIDRLLKAEESASSKISTSLAEFQKDSPSTSTILPKSSSTLAVRRPQEDSLDHHHQRSSRKVRKTFLSHKHDNRPQFIVPTS
jgi:hypothetical protein